MWLAPQGHPAALARCPGLILLLALNNPEWPLSDVSFHRAGRDPSSQTPLLGPAGLHLPWVSVGIWGVSPRIFVLRKAGQPGVWPFGVLPESPARGLEDEEPAPAALGAPTLLTPLLFLEGAVLLSSPPPLRLRFPLPSMHLLSLPTC